MRQAGDSIAAMALVCVDNPMLPGTGHRICNDCMKACVFQKQEPVNIPEIETAVLTDVLALPWGFEIYGLLTRWNPLNVKRPHALPYNGKNVLVVGLGPAGYTLAHHLTCEGFAVVGVDGLKIEPLPVELRGDETHAAAPHPRLRQDVPGARRARPARVRRGQRVRHHRSLGQELPHRPLRDAGAAAPPAHVRRRPLRRHARPRTTPGSSASTTSPSPRARGGPPSSR